MYAIKYKTPQGVSIERRTLNKSGNDENASFFMNTQPIFVQFNEKLKFTWIVTTFNKNVATNGPSRAEPHHMRPKTQIHSKNEQLFCNGPRFSNHERRTQTTVLSYHSLYAPYQKNTVDS